ncbi:MAG: NADH-quinone oxidoreductase subunit N [Rickettsiales bacterium]|jgi:NADH-quinone oxidoreductase subunit N|nr:NADH-quinone oxidoreductase subunit N [Rickettsiales bacterium]
MLHLENLLLLPFEHFLVAEVFIAISSLMLLIYAVIKGDKHSNQISCYGVAILILAAFCVGELGADGSGVDGFLLYLKQLICILSALCLLLFIGHSRYNIRNSRAEFPVLILFSVVGALILISARDFLSFYLGLELMSFALYILTAINRGNIKSQEAALKYFVLGCLSSGFILFGISILYGVSGSIYFSEIANNINVIAEVSSINNVALILPVIFIIIGLLFKVSAVPFHMWAPDVYEGSPTPVTVFIASVPKVAVFIIFFRILQEPFASLAYHYEKIIYLVAMLSLVVGALGAINQTNFKRLLAYSAMNHVGFMLIALVHVDDESLKALLLYLTVYSVVVIGAFAFLMVVKQSHFSNDVADKKPLEDLSALSGLSKQSPYAAFAITILMLSMAGLPPFAGFFGKFFIFMVALNNSFIEIVILGAITTVIAAFYYLRIIKIIYFDKATEEYIKKPALATVVVLVITVLFNLLLFLSPSVLLGVIEQSAAFIF